MKIFISDLHLGDGSKADDFHRDKEFLDFLTYIEDNHAELIVLGDLYELWQCDLDKIAWTHSAVLNRLKSLVVPEATYIYGNHDYFPFSKYSSGTYKKDNIFAQHGHQYDIFNRYKNPLFNLKWPIGKYVTVLLGEIERWFCKDVDVWAEKMRDKFGSFLWEAANLQNRGHYTSDSTIHMLRVNAYRILRDNNIVIFGHTHKAILENFYTGIYANCGAWVDNVEPTYIAVTENGGVELRNGLNHKIIKLLFEEKPNGRTNDL